MAVRILDNCKGCTGCFYKCPTGAILGRRREVHRVEPSLCINCLLCGFICPFEAVLDSSGKTIPFMKRSRRPVAHLLTGMCQGCPLCRDICPEGAIRLKGTDFTPFPIPSILEGRCTGCSLCVLICPHDALYLKERGEKVLLPYKKGVEKRRSHRFAVRVDVLYDTSLCILSAPVINISMEGLFMETPNLIPPGETIRITPIEGGGAGMPRVLGQVVRVKRADEEPLSQPAGMGIKFTDLTEEQKERLRELIESMQEKEGEG